MTQKNLPKLSWIDVTPEIAQGWLNTANTNNRRVRRWWVNALSQMMRRDEWTTSPQPISFDSGGVLLDGQHRLLAVASSGKTITLSVAHNVDKSVMRFIDTGVRRTTEDTTGLDKKTAEVARRAVTVLYGGVEAKNGNTVLRVADCGVKDLSIRLNDFCPKVSRIFSSAPMRLAAIALVMDGHNETGVFARYEVFVYQEYGAMSKMMQSFNKQVLGMKIHPNELLARGMRILNPNIKNENVSFRLANESQYIDRFKTILKAALEDKPLQLDEIDNGN